jgi:hypothetical protein
MNEIKKESDRILEKLGYGEFDFLPSLDLEINIRDIIQIKERALALSLIVQVSNNIVDSVDVFEYINRYDLSNIFSEKELSFLKYGNDEDKINETYKAECVFTLLWALNVIDDLTCFDDFADLNEIENYPLYINNLKDPSVFLLSLDYKLKGEDEIIGMLDLYSRLDYVCDYMTLNNQPLSILSALIYERRYTLIWMMNKENKWDNIECNSII